MAWPARVSTTRFQLGARQPRQNLVERLVGQPPHFVLRQRLDGVWHGHRPVLGRAQRLGWARARSCELRRDHRRRGQALILEEHPVVHTARGAGPSVSESLDQDVALLQDLSSQLVRGRPGEGRLFPPEDGLGRRALSQQLLDPVQQVVALGLGAG